MPKTGVGARNDSGAAKRKRKAKDEKLAQSMQGALLKHFRATGDQNRAEIPASVDKSELNASSSVELNTDNESSNCVLNTEEIQISSSQLACSSNVVVAENSALTNYQLSLDSNSETDQSVDYTDIGKWPPTLSATVTKFIVQKGPNRIIGFEFPVDDQKRHFAAKHYIRKMPNGEMVNRRWLTYSKTLNSVFCFCCKLFTVKEKTRLSGQEGHNNWQNLSYKLPEHETSSNHKQCHNMWIDFENRLLHNRTLDHKNEKMIDDEKKYWRSVLERLISIVQFLAERNLPFRGSDEMLGSSQNGNFLGLVELISNFDSVLSEHLRRISSKDIRDHYLGNRIQNEFIELISDKILRSICSNITKAKYYSVILDCTPDISHQEQMTVILRYVEIQDFEKVTIKESFVGFLEVDETTGSNLCDTFLKKLSDLGLSINDCRGQGYDNGANMRGQNKGVQARILELNARALFVPCGCHSWNLILGDMANSSNMAISFFHTLQKIYVLFSASTHRWSIFKKHVKTLTVKPLSDTRWECRVDSVRAIRFQVGEVYDALVEISETSKEAISRCEAASLAKELKVYKFLVSLCIWYEILIQFSFVSKSMQKQSMVISGVLELIQNSVTFLTNFKLNGFQKAKNDAEKLAIELEMETDIIKFPDVTSMRRRKVKKMFSYEAEDEPVSDPEQNFRIHFFNVLLDQALMSVEERFNQIKSFDEIFGFLFNSEKYEREKKLMQSCQSLANLLGDLDGSELFTEITMIISNKSFSSPLEFLEYIIKNRLQEVFPNLVIALRVLLTVPITVASAERSFSKLKLIKTYLRSTMSQQRLNGLAMISIENELSSQIEYSDIIDDFAARKARKISL